MSSNPYARQTAKLRSAVLDTMNEVEIRLITQRLLTSALQGDIAAIKLVFAYAIGKPENCFNPDEVDRLEWETRQCLSIPLDEVEAITERMSAMQACAVAEATKTPVARQVGLEITERLLERGLLERTQPVDSRADQPAPSRRASAGKQSSDPSSTKARPEARPSHKGKAGCHR